jgi:hypothetical protein
MRRIVATLVLATLAAGLSGCQLAGAYAVTEFSLATEPDALTIVQGGSAELVLRVDRPLGLDVSPLAVTVEIHRAPEGVGLAEGESVTIPAGIHEEPVTLEVGATAEPGEHEVVMRGANGIKSRDATVTLTIEAAP